MNQGAGRRIDLFLSEEGFANLEKIKELFGRAANTAAIRDVIAAYPKAMIRVDELEAKLRVANEALAERDAAIKAFTKSFNGLLTLK